MKADSPNWVVMGQAQRRVLLGTDPRVTLSKRASDGLLDPREYRADTVGERGLVLQRSGDDEIRWAYAGSRSTLRAAPRAAVDPKQPIDDHQLRLWVTARGGRWVTRRLRGSLVSRSKSHPWRAKG